MRRERERRKHFRVEWNSPATIYYLNSRVTRGCIVRNFSNGGAKIVGVKAATIPDQFMLRITPGPGRRHKCCVLWRSDDAMRVEFIDHIASAEEADLAYSVRERDTISSMPP
jgi:PilZ domain